ncbi:MAG: hypothetical protein Q7S27_00450 [Nanoarchaeota archaeon]|nr:hypothetical protein [Nanoarchaeota archaeon]
MKRGFIFAFILVILLSSSVFALGIVEGKKKVIGVYAYLDFREDPDSLVPFVKEDAVNILYGETGSVRSYFKEMSFGKVDIVGFDGNAGNLDDIFVLPIPLTQEECTPLKFLEKVVEELKKRGVVEHELIIAMLSIEGNCLDSSGGGFYTSKNYGTAENPLLIYFAVDITGEGFGKYELGDLRHEVAHTFGIGHAMYKKCFFQEGVSPDECKDIIEHGDPFDLMGSNLRQFPHSNARLLEFVGWLTIEGEHKIKEINKESFAVSKTYTLKPLSDPKPGLKALKIPHGFYYDWSRDIPYITHLYVEWRKQIGLDSELSTLSNSNVFEGVLLHISDDPGTGFRYSSLFHPFPIDTTLKCFSGGDCPRAKKAVLPYGETYTDPNSGTKIKVGFPNADGLPITIEELGRTDFEAPVVGDINILNTDNPCIKEAEVNPSDESGISKVEWYELDTSNRLNSKLVETDTNGIYKFTFDFKNIIAGRQFRGWIRVYDNAKQQWVTADNYRDQEFIIKNNDCLSDVPQVVIKSPYLNEDFSTEFVEPSELNYDGLGILTIIYYDLEFQDFVKGPVPLRIEMKNNRPIQTYTLKYEDVYSGTGTSKLVIKSEYLKHLLIKEKILEISPNIIAGEHLLSLTVSSDTILTTWVKIRIKVLPSNPFVRGDVNNNGNVELGDAIKILDYLYSGGQDLQCDDSGDANDNGIVDISDAIIILNYLFNGNPPSLAKPNNLGELDETYDKLSCGHSVCRNKMCSFEYGKGDDECLLDVDCGLTDEEVSEEYPNGDNPFVKGNLPYIDRCIDNLFLEEYNYIAPDYNTEIDCSELGNYICKNGACIKP